MPTLPPGVTPIDMTQQAAPPPLRQRVANAWAALSGRPFGPNQPLQANLPPPAPPRQYEYPPGSNIILQPRSEDTRMTPFEQLRNLAALYDVASMCIAARIEEMQGLNWSIAPKDKKMQGVESELADITAFWNQPDGLNDYHAWMGMLLYELFTTDSMTLYRRPDQVGRLCYLEPVDGSTIKPLLDERGRTFAYQQIVYGWAETAFRRPSADQPDESPQYSLQELIYKPRWVRTWTPYGYPPTEWIIIRVNTALRKQSFDLAWFTDGNIPDMIATAPEGVLNPKQIQEFEIWFNAVLEGNDAARRKVRFVPWNMNFTTLKDFQYNTVLDEWMLRITCAAYSVPPQELGFTMDVNKASAQMQESVNERRGLKPLGNWLKTSLLDPIIQKDLRHLYESKLQILSLPGQPTRPAARLELEWQWHWGDSVDELVQAQTDQIYMSSGVITPDEVRTMRYGDVLEGKAPGVPGMMGFPPGYLAGSDAQQYEPAQGAASRPALGLPAPAQPSTPGVNKMAEADLRAWRRKAVRAEKAVPFQSEHIPAGITSQIEAGMQKAVTVDDIRKVFDQVLQAAPPEGAAPVPFPIGQHTDDPLDQQKRLMAYDMQAALRQYFAGLQQRIIQAETEAQGANS